jgi:hypothetical protein
MLDTDFAYLAGAMDSDGYFTIKKSTYHIRVRHDAVNAVYSEKIGLSQVTPQVPEMLKSFFGGSLGFAKGQTENSRPMYRWMATNLKASKACRDLLPYLRIKQAQALKLIELSSTRQTGNRQFSLWFEKEFPDWRLMELITVDEVAAILGYKGNGMVSQAVRNGTLLSLPYDYRGKARPRIPRLLVERLAQHAKTSKDGRATAQPPELIAWKERLWLEVRELNKLGVKGTSPYHRTGHHAPA